MSKTPSQLAAEAEYIFKTEEHVAYLRRTHHGKEYEKFMTARELNQAQLKEAETQTTPRKEQTTYKKKIEKIIGHKTEGAKMGVRFEIKWKGFKIQTKERSKTILELEGGEDLLKEYLLKLQETSNRSFVYMLENEPGLEDLLAEE